MANHCAGSRFARPATPVKLSVPCTTNWIGRLAWKLAFHIPRETGFPSASGLAMPITHGLCIKERSPRSLTAWQTLDRAPGIYHLAMDAAVYTCIRLFPPSAFAPKSRHLNACLIDPSLVAMSDIIRHMQPATIGNVAVFVPSQTLDGMAARLVEVASPTPPSQCSQRSSCRQPSSPKGKGVTLRVFTVWNW